MQFTCLVQLVDATAAADGWSYFRFKIPMPAPMWDSVFPFSREQLHLMGHGHPVQPKVNTQEICVEKWYFGQMVKNLCQSSPQ